MGVLQVRMRKLAVRSAVLVIFALSLPAWPQAAQPNATTLPAATRPHEAAQAFRFAVMTDTHIAAPAELARFRQFLHTIRDQNVDFLLMLGDLCGHAPEYLPQIKEVIDHSGLKVYPIAGNHDDNYGHDPQWYTAAFPQAYYSFDHKGWHFIMCDSQLIVDNKDPVPLAWLQKDLASLPAGTPAVFCQHYPPGELQPGKPDLRRTPGLMSSPRLT